MNWSVRSLLNPVITRALIYGVNPIDLEYVLKEVEKVPIINSKMLEKTWIEQWENKSKRFIMLAEKAQLNNNDTSAKEFYTLATQCYYASYLINSNDIESKRDIYKKLEFCYQNTLAYYHNRAIPIKIPMGNDRFLLGYLHLPNNSEDNKSYPCAIICSGIGSCKEELNTLARPLIERSIAVLACDFPGTGSSLFDYDIKCQCQEIELAFTKIMEFLKSREDIDSTKLCSYGLCMGGGYAYRFASMYPEIKVCANLFPLFINKIESSSIPRWMQQGSWAIFQSGIDNGDEYINSMSKLQQGTVSCNYLMVHGKFDNWMTLKDALEMYSEATGYKEKIIVEESPVFSNKETVTHTMPVGEQLHWLKYVVADWIVEYLYK